MTNMYFSKSHEYVRVEDGIATIGITNYAQGQLGDIVFVELPEVGRGFSVGDEAAVVESVKAASEVYAPVSGEISAANDALSESPSLVNEDPEGAGWFFKLTLKDGDDFSHLMDKAAYDAFVEGED